MPRAVGGTGQSRKPFLESPADFSTRAPNLIRLGQGRRARQDLVRNSESTTKCGDCGDDSKGGIRKYRRFVGNPKECTARSLSFSLD